MFASLCQGAFFGVNSVVAAELVPEVKHAGVIATVFIGLTLANILSVPFGTFLGQMCGWRSTFWMITVIGTLVWVGIMMLVPKVKAAVESQPRAGRLKALNGPYRS